MGVGKLTGEGSERPRFGPPVAASTLYCEVCGEETPHRILRFDPRTRPGMAGGLARCSRCRWTHPFATEPIREVEVDQIISDGPASRRQKFRLDAGLRIQVGEPLPGSSDGPQRVQRIDRRDGRRVATAKSEEVRTVWTILDRGAVVPVSLVEGRITRTARLTFEPTTALAIGDTLEVDRVNVTIVGLRARGNTWRQPGDVFPASEVTRLYARRTVRPPAGSIGWSRARESPSSRESSTSRAERSRSGPGVNRKRS